MNIVALNERPDLAPLVAEWLNAEFGHARGPSLEQRVEHLRAQASPEQTFVLCDNGIPVATASLVINDLPSRPDLTPWLAGHRDASARHAATLGDVHAPRPQR